MQSHDIAMVHSGSPGPVDVKILVQMNNRMAAIVLVDNVILYVDVDLVQWQHLPDYLLFTDL
jgi:hypothetical protein